MLASQTSPQSSDANTSTGPIQEPGDTTPSPSNNRMDATLIFYTTSHTHYTYRRALLDPRTPRTGPSSTTPT
jgi:hypothetical protein